MTRPAPRPGFSLIEALVVLAVGGMALAIIFSIGTKAGDSGFAIGRKAMSAADADLAVSDLRSVLRSTLLRPEATFLMAVDRPMVGDARRLEADVVMERATQCGPQGWAGRMTLEIEPRGAERLLVCDTGDQRAVLFVLPGGDPTFSYSLDGQTWTPSYSNVPTRQMELGEFRSVRIWIRFAAPPLVDVVERVSSGRPEAWGRNDGL